ncbi:ABC transporter permease subunit [Paenibacillus alginolyticus]|uniref:ABC transporter permease subunit n=1 Tax=Paenibacillus alginolyticus TaxID=59839 RepID=UPI0028A862FB|nr:ABC transporter permease subunit [Paenibacillus frigoriresistens]
MLGGYKLLFGFPAPIVLALLLNELRSSVYKRFVQTVSYLPYFLSTVVVSSIIVMLLSPSTGWLSHMFQRLGFPTINFLQESEWFRTIYVSSEIWQQVGWGSIIFLAAMTTIDPQLYEAAKMDGAGRLSQIWHVTLPGIATTVVIMFILQIGHVLEIGFEKVFLLSNAVTYDTFLICHMPSCKNSRSLITHLLMLMQSRISHLRRGIKWWLMMGKSLILHLI